MVNVDKPINGKNSEADKPTRRPRNAKLNSSKSSGLSLAAKRKLNCSREDAIKELRRWFSDEEAEEYVNSFEEQTGAKITRIATPEEAEQYDGDFWATKDGKESLWCRGNGVWYEAENLDSSGSACGADTADEKLNSSRKRRRLTAMRKKLNSSKKLNCDASGISGAQDLLQKFVEDAASRFDANLTLEWEPYSWSWSPEKKEIRYVIYDHPEDSDDEHAMSSITVLPSTVEEFANSTKTFIQKTVIPYLVENAPEVVRIHGLFNDGNSYLELGDFNTDAPDIDLDDYDEGLDSSKKLNCGAEDEVKITTESGNEVSIGDIQIVQNPTTNELALFIKESEDDEIPEGFVVIGKATPTQTELSGEGAVCPECGQDPCVCEGGEDLDSSKKELNCDSAVGDCFAALWSAYIDDSYKCACCGKSFPAGHNSVHLGGHKPDGMHFIYEYTKENREGNGVNYDPYNLPPEDSEGGIFKVVVGEEADDEGYRWLNFCRNCWPKLTSKSPEEIYAEYSGADLDSSKKKETK